jgi:(p)ppGpp synthase/HD superfamily hydrolase
MYGPRFESALAFACAAHFGQIRKGSGAPYITHPMAVASIVGAYGGDEDQAIAALLHDVMEDCGVPEERIAQRYGSRVATIVAACTDTTERPKPPWRPRKEAHIAKVRGQPGEVKLVIAADKLHNALSILRDLRRPSVGEVVWDRFTADRPDVLWYYGAMAEALGAGWDHELHGELRHAVERLND